MITALITALRAHDARIQSLVQGRCSILFDKKHGVPDVNVTFLPEGLSLEYGLKSVANSNKDAAQWLNQYHAFLSKQKKDTLSPVEPRCTVMVKVGYNGMIQYFLTYMVAHSDNSLAQDTAQGALFHSEGLSVARSSSPEQAASEPAGHW
jgi:hypothetical protein